MLSASAPRLRIAIDLHELRAHRFDIAEFLERALSRRPGRLAECLEIGHALGDVEANFIVHVSLRSSEAEPREPAPASRHALSILVPGTRIGVRLVYATRADNITLPPASRSSLRPPPPHSAPTRATPP